MIDRDKNPASKRRDKVKPRHGRDVSPNGGPYATCISHDGKRSVPAMVKPFLIVGCGIALLGAEQKGIHTDNVAVVSSVVPSLPPQSELTNTIRRFCVDSDVKGRHFGLFRVFEGRAAARANVGKELPGGFAEWQRDYLASPGVLPNQAEGLMIGGDCAIRSVRDGVTTTIVIIGSNPLVRNSGGLQYEIIHIAVREHPARRRGEGDGVRLQFYVKTTQAADVMTAKAILNDLMSVTKGQHVSVVVRADAWFIMDDDVPVRLPFEPYETPPTIEEHSLTPEARCLSGETGPRCL
jgi:hypothetical protein